MKLPSPSERQAVTIGIWLMAGGLLLMAREDPSLWDIELFKILMQAVIISGIGTILAFHFSANKGDEVKSDNTAKAFEAIKATAEVAQAPTDLKTAATVAADKVADAAVDAADEVTQTAAEKLDKMKDDYDFDRNK